jgi:hypothetical protein
MTIPIHGTLWINSFAHGRTIYDLKLDARAVRAALEAASSNEVVSRFIELVLLADIDPVDLEQLLRLVSERSGLGRRVIARTLKAARAKAAASNAEHERKRRQAERIDPRPEIPAPAIDAPWLPQMRAARRCSRHSERCRTPNAEQRRHVDPMPNAHAYRDACFRTKRS